GRNGYMNQSRVDELAARTQEDAVLDVVNASFAAPRGVLEVSVTLKGVVRVAFGSESLDDVLQELADTVSPRVIESPARLDSVRRELDEYFTGDRREFTTPIDWRLSHGFLLRAREACLAIPFGEVRTYSELAEAAGS